MDFNPVGGFPDFLYEVWLILFCGGCGGSIGLIIAHIFIFLSGLWVLLKTSIRRCSRSISSDIILPMAKKKRTQKNIGQVNIPLSHPNPPEPHEVDVAMVLARHYQTTVEFLVPIDDYKRKSPDIVMFGVQWEIKCPIGTSRVTIKNQFQRGTKQARNIVIDTRRTKMKYESIEKSVLFEMEKRPYIKKVILIDKQKNVIAIDA
jgi:hypothetical protein